MASLASWVHTTTLTILFGTTITRLGALPARVRMISGSANAAVSATSLGVSLANCKVPRGLDKTFPALDLDGMHRAPQIPLVFSDVSMGGYTRQVDASLVTMGGAQ